jgi:ribonuclease III
MIDKRLVEQLEKKINYTFSDTSLLEQALTHRSFKAKNNERLEFLGDSILNFIDTFPLLPEGDLSRLRSDLVKSKTLSDIATQLDLGSFMQLGEGELKSAGWRRPSILADCLEALIAAIYLDANLATVQRLIGQWFKELINDIDPKKIDKDAKSLLQELLQAQQISRPKYLIAAITGEAHAQTFDVVCEIEKLGIHSTGQATSRKEAEQQAALRAIELIKKIQS